METLLTTRRWNARVKRRKGRNDFAAQGAVRRIPAPSHHEERRAEWILCMAGKARAVRWEIDDLRKNVRCGFGLSQYQDIVVIMAHIDALVSSPDLQPMPMRE
ncbi:MAG: hypothetical protein ACLUHE_16250 [Christensenellales bacterium]